MVHCRECEKPMVAAPKRLEVREIPYPLRTLLTALDLPLTTVRRFRCPEGHAVGWMIPVVDGGYGFLDVVQSVPAN